MRTGSGGRGGRSGESGGNDARSRQTREQILKATQDCLIAVGFEHITTRRIADTAGVNVAALHYHFGSKEALLAAAVDFTIAQSVDALRAAAESAPDAATALAAGFEATWARVRQQPGLLRYDLVVRGFHDHAAHRRALESYEVFRELTRRVIGRHVAEGGVLREGLTPEQLATYINASTDGVILRYALTGDEDDARRSLGLILKHARQLMGIEDERVV